MTEFLIASLYIFQQCFVCLPCTDKVAWALFYILKQQNDKHDSVAFSFAAPALGSTTATLRDTYPNRTLRWTDGKSFGAETVHHHGGVVAPSDPTNRAKDMFNIVPRRHDLSWCNFRATKGKSARKLGHMVMAWKC